MGSALHSLSFKVLTVLCTDTTQTQSPEKIDPTLPGHFSRSDQGLTNNRTTGCKISPYLQLSHCLSACCFGGEAPPGTQFLSSPGCSPPLGASPPAAGAECWQCIRISPDASAEVPHSAGWTWPASCEEWTQRPWMSHSHSPCKENTKTPSFTTELFWFTTLHK